MDDKLEGYCENEGISDGIDDDRESKEVATAKLET